MGKLFGTDGIRGVANVGLDAALAYRVGLAAAQVLAQEKQEGRPLFAIGKDTRISSDLLEGALIAGLCSAGADVLHLGVIPTPAVAWIAVDSHADAGVVISASHNPYEYNGIKLFNGNGFKLSDALERKIEDIILANKQVPLKTHAEIGAVTYADLRESEDYINHLAATIEDDLSGLHILVDCANGAAASTAARLFDRFPKLHTDIINADPDGTNINASCGSTHLGQLKEMVRAGSYDLGIAFDGDADRCLAVDETGDEIDGDRFMAVCALALQEQGQLPGNAIVATVMSNLGLHRFAKAHGMTLVCTDVGDRNVLEEMVRRGYVIGGEQSGHLIFHRYATTGDGQLSALQFLQILHRSGAKASALVSGCKRYPQVLINISVADKEQKNKIMASPILAEAILTQERYLAEEGRVLVRPSGTEALVRVMVEAKEENEAQRCAQELADVIKKL